MTRVARGRNIDGEPPEVRMRRIFIDRADAGRVLAESLSAWRSAPATVVLALPRGGVPVA